MLFLYTLFLFALALVHFAVRRRVASLERQYAGVARQADELFRRNSYRDGNSNRVDPYQAAKKQLQLGLLAEKRDRVEARYVRWQARADRLGRLLARARAWKGRKLPYAFGALDVAGLMALVDYLGAGQYVNARALVQLVTTRLFN
jgi:hypothetical protein